MRRTKRMRMAGIAAVTTALTMASAGPAGAASLGGGDDVGFPDFDWVNDDTCMPSADHPRPVLLVHGTTSNAGEMENIGRALADQGHCVFAVNYGADDSSIVGQFPGALGLGDLDASAEEVHRAIRHVAGETNAGRAAGAIDVLGYSQGAALVKLAMNEHGDAEVVDTAVYLAGSHRGTTMGGIDALNIHAVPEAVAIGDAVLGRSSLQQVVGSEQVERLRALPDTQPGVRYAVIVSDDDTTVTPPRSGFLEAGPGATVDNVAVQDVCPGAPRIDHVGIRDHEIGADLVADAFAGRTIACG